MPAGNPKTSQEVLMKVKYEYEAGTYKSISELAEKYGINPKSLHARMVRENWKEKRQEILRKAELKVQKSVVNEASEWVERVKARSKKDWSIIDESIDSMVQAAGGVEPSDLRSYIQARKILDDMARRCIGIADPTQNIDLTSKGLSIGESFISAIAKMRSDADIPEISNQDLEKVLEAEIIDDSSVSTVRPPHI